jgi:hypothetical protein
MHVVEGASQWPGEDYLRPFVPLDFTYNAAHPDLQHKSTLALVDSGSDKAIMPRHFLPALVAWEDLTPVGMSFNVIPPREFETRVWRADLSVFGVQIASEILVCGDSFRHYPILGLGDIFRHFHVAFAWANQPGPIMTLVPVGQVEAQPTTRWRIDARNNAWEGSYPMIEDPSLPPGMLAATTIEPWTGRMPRLEPLFRGRADREAPRQLDAVLPNRETRRRLGRPR